MLETNMQSNFHPVNAVSGCNGPVDSASRICGSQAFTGCSTSMLMTLSDYLAKRSAEICRDNGCTEDQHNCESYAYINADCQLMDVCMPDYFQGSSKPYAAIPLPWTGSQAELEAAVKDSLTTEQP